MPTPDHEAQLQALLAEAQSIVADFQSLDARLACLEQFIHTAMKAAPGAQSYKA